MMPKQVGSGPGEMEVQYRGGVYVVRYSDYRTNDEGHIVVEVSEVLQVPTMIPLKRRCARWYGAVKRLREAVAEERIEYKPEDMGYVD
jgi:hypothetical protein